MIDDYEIFIIMIYVIFALIACSAGLNLKKWQYWGLLACMVLVQVLTKLSKVT